MALCLPGNYFLIIHGKACWLGSEVDCWLILDAKLQPSWARPSESYLRRVIRHEEKTESRILERSLSKEYAAPRKREIGHPWPKLFAAWGRRSAISETLRLRVSTTQAQRRCIGKSGRRRGWHTRSGTRRTYFAKSAGLRMQNHSTWKLKTIYRQQGDEAALDLANTLRGLASVTESSAKPDAARLLWQEARQLYAKCNVEAGVAECDKKLSQ